MFRRRSELEKILAVRASISRFPDGPDPGQNTIAFCNLVAAEQMRMLVRYAIGEDWWHDGTSTAGRWSFEHRFIEAETEPFE